MERQITILITGSKGFLGTSLIKRINAIKNNINIKILTFDQDDNLEDLEKKVINSNYIFHFAAVQRLKENEHYTDNISLTKLIQSYIKMNNLNNSIIFTSSIHVLGNTEYGKTKKIEEDIVKLNEKNYIFRLPNIFGPGAKINYTSVVATFCYNISHNLNIEIHNENNVVKLFYVDDLMDIFINLLNDSDFEMKNRIIEISNFEKITIGDLSRILYLLNEGMDLGYIYKKHGYNFDFLEKLKRTFEWYRDMI